MNGFAPLIEGFLAFALTMLALTTGVSAIVGAINQLRRKHARGLRDMVRLLYLREIVPLEGEGKRAATSGPDGTSGDALAPGARRAEFIYDMTFMPLPVVVERLETNGPDYWRNQLESAEWLSGERWYHVLAHPRRVGRYWRSLRYSLQCLQDGEFRERLTCSDAGVQLKAQRGVEGAWAGRLGCARGAAAQAVPGARRGKLGDLRAALARLVRGGRLRPGRDVEHRQPRSAEQLPDGPRPAAAGPRPQRGHHGARDARRGHGRGDSRGARARAIRRRLRAVDQRGTRALWHARDHPRECDRRGGRGREGRRGAAGKGRGAGEGRPERRQRSRRPT